MLQALLSGGGGGGGGGGSLCYEAHGVAWREGSLAERREEGVTRSKHGEAATQLGEGEVRGEDLPSGALISTTGGLGRVQFHLWSTIGCYTVM